MTDQRTDLGEGAAVCGAQQNLFVLARVSAPAVQIGDAEIELIEQSVGNVVGAVADDVHQLSAVAAVKHHVQHSRADEQREGGVQRALDIAENNGGCYNDYRVH